MSVPRTGKRVATVIGLSLVRAHKASLEHPCSFIEMALADDGSQSNDRRGFDPSDILDHVGPDDCREESIADKCHMERPVAIEGKGAGFEVRQKRDRQEG